jgi:probable phosphoglycerate mutase
VIYLLRHGQTEFNTERRIQGRCDSPLTELGKAQARAMGETLKARIDGQGRFSIVSSPLLRALASAEIVASHAGVADSAVTDDRLQEIGCGSWEGQRWPDLTERDPALGKAPNFLAAWARHCREGESLDAVIERLAGFLQWAEGRDLIVVSHACAGAILRSLYAGTDREALLDGIAAPRAGIYRLHDGEVERIELAEGQ